VYLIGGLHDDWKKGVVSLLEEGMAGWQGAVKFKFKIKFKIKFKFKFKMGFVLCIGA
jgi:hypothetical protein